MLELSLLQVLRMKPLPIQIEPPSFDVAVVEIEITVDAASNDPSRIAHFGKLHFLLRQLRPGNPLFRPKDIFDDVLQIPKGPSPGTKRSDTLKS